MRRHRSQWHDFVRDILYGEACEQGTTDLAHRGWRFRSAVSKLHSCEDGKISFVSIFTVLAFMLLILLVTNVGVTVNDKIELQNAADATAYSSALWQARSMNAVTTANHLMGELTAITVVLDSFGGSMLGTGESYRSGDSARQNKHINDIEHSYIGGHMRYGYAAKVSGAIDERLVAALKKLVASDEGNHFAGAMLYDSKLTLKFCAHVALWTKERANQILFIAELAYKSGVLAWVGGLLELVAVPIHAYMSIKLTEIGIEWLWLEAIEHAMAIVNADGAMRSGIRDAAVPVLSMYADTVVGSSAAARLGRGTAPLNESTRRTQEQLARTYRLSACGTYPSWNELRLAVVQEEPPVSEEPDVTKASYFSLGEWGYPKSEWRGDFTSRELKALRQYPRTVQRMLDGPLGELRAFIGPLGDAAGAVQAGLNKLGIGGFAEKVSPEISNAMDLMGELQSLLRGLTPPLAPKSDDNTYVSNPCISDSLRGDLRLPKFYWQAERQTQWVRATYPYVNEYRAPVVSFLRKYCQLSDAATYYSHWSNRYTLANSFEFRKRENSSQEANRQERGLLAELRVEVLTLRKQFEDAADDTEQEINGNIQVGEFDQISRRLLRVIGEYEGRIASLSQWFADVRGHQGLAQTIAERTQAFARSDAPQDEFTGLAEELALINLLDELLSAMEELLDSLELNEPHMYVMKGMTPSGKGQDEPWIRDEALAEQLFCVTAYVSRPSTPLFGVGVYTHPVDGPRHAVASAIVYNANGRSDRPNQSRGLQSDTGWDTLNWAMPVKAPEWGDHKPSERSDISAWNLASPREASDVSRVRLNWQVKLVPLTPRQLDNLNKANPSLEIEHALVNH